MADDDSVSIRKSKPKNAKRWKSVSNAGEIILLVVEIIIGLISLGLLRYYYILIARTSRLYLAIITTGGFVLISGAFLIGAFIKNNAPLQTALLTILGSALYFATGAMSIDFYARQWSIVESNRIGLVFGALCIVNGFIYILHSLLAFRRHQRYSKLHDDDI